jgi:polar amino acid transport system ATP-binding protein
MIEIKNLRKEYGDLVVLDDVNLSVSEGEVISVIGPSGTGKSTLLRCINLLDPPTSGEIYIDGENILAPHANVPRLRQKMGMVFQNFNLFEHLLAIENIMLAPVKLRGMSRQEAYDKGMELLEMVGIVDKAMEFPSELSGGQKQRVAIARTLAMEPKIALFDEPTSALDPTRVSEVLSVIRRLAKNGLTMMVVTHEMDFAREVSTRVLYIDEKGVYEDGSPEQIFDHPVREKTRDFTQRVKIFEYAIASRSFDLYDMNAGVEQFSLKNYIAPQTSRHIQLICEEMLVNLIIPALEDGAIDIVFTMKKSERSERVELMFGFPSDSAFSASGGDSLAGGIVKNIAASITEEYSDGRNLISMEV